VRLVSGVLTMLALPVLAVAHQAPTTAVGASHALAAIVSVYTDLSENVCTTLEYNEQEASSTQACEGTHGYRLLVLDGDARQSVTIIAPDGREHPLDYWSVITGGFSALGEQAEWRVLGADEAATPIALIVRVNAEEFEDDGGTRTVSYLAVAKITSDGSCVTDRIAPGPEQKERARQAADTSADRSCLGGWGEQDHGYTLLGLDDESPIHTRRIDLDPGVAQVLSNAVVRGERDVYLLAAEGGQELRLQISSVENNAVFDLVSPSGMLLVNETMEATVFLPHTGDYQIIVGGTRGNAGYELVATIR